MSIHVLVGVDGSEQAQQAADYTFKHYPEATVTLLNVIDPVEAGYSLGSSAVPGYTEEWFEQSKDSAEDLLETHADQAEATGFSGEIETAVEVGRPARTIVTYAEETGVDHVVMGSHGRSGVTRVLLGSVAETVVRRSPVPVTVVR